MKFVCDNYNLGIYRAYINVTPGTYIEKLGFGSYTATTGEVYLRSTDSTQKVVVQNPTQTTITANVSNGNYTFERFNFVCNVSTENVTTPSTVVGCLFTVSYAQVLCLDCGFSFNVSTVDRPISMNGRMVWVGSYGIVEVQNNASFSATNSSDMIFYAVFVSSGGKFNFLGSTVQTYCYISGDFSTVVRTSNGSIQANNNGPTYDVVVTTRQGEQCTGRRYYAEAGGSINTMGGGPEFFPGTNPGGVESSTYSWYK